MQWVTATCVTAVSTVSTVVTVGWVLGGCWVSLPYHTGIPQAEFGGVVALNGPYLLSVGGSLVLCTCSIGTYVKVVPPAKVLLT